jgi:excisionase family DNA binding protein
MTQRTILELLEEPKRAHVRPLEPAALTIKDAAAYLGISRWTVNRLRASGELEAFRVGAGVRITRASADAYIERQRAAEAERLARA